jgi:DNA-binding protein YbaB
VSVSPDPGGLSRLLSDAMAALAQVQQQGGDQAEPAEGRGGDEDGLIAITVSAGGRVTEVSVNPRAMRMDSVTLGEHLMEAVNAALDDLRDNAPAASAADFGGLSEQLKEIRENTERRFASYTGALVQAQERIAGQGGR